MGEQMDSGPALACDLSAIEAREREAHEALAARLFTEAVQAREELPAGYAFRFPAERYADIAAFIANERLCCPFFTFTLEVAADQGPISLRITGGEGAKAILRSAIDGAAMPR